jgi:hypothetical protein
LVAADFFRHVDVLIAAAGYFMSRPVVLVLLFPLDVPVLLSCSWCDSAVN